MMTAWFEAVKKALGQAVKLFVEGIDCFAPKDYTHINVFMIRIVVRIADHKAVAIKIQILLLKNIFTLYAYSASKQAYMNIIL